MPLYYLRKVSLSNSFSLFSDFAIAVRFQIVLARLVIVVILAEGVLAGFCLCHYPRPRLDRGRGNDRRTVSAHTPKASR